MLKHAFQSRPFLPLGGIGPVTAVAIVVVKFSSGRLLRSQSEFGIGLAPLQIARGECKQPETCGQYRTYATPKMRRRLRTMPLCNHFPHKYFLFLPSRTRSTAPKFLPSFPQPPEFHRLTMIEQSHVCRSEAGL